MLINVIEYNIKDKIHHKYNDFIQDNIIHFKIINTIYYERLVNNEFIGISIKKKYYNE